MSLSEISWFVDITSLNFRPNREFFSSLPLLKKILILKLGLIVVWPK